jgi:ribosome-associated protein
VATPLPLRELHFSFARSSGPGGQNVNKVESKAVLHWDLGASALPAALLARFRARYRRRIGADGVFQLASQRHRQRERNVADCIAKFAALLEEVSAPSKPRRPTRPTRASKERRLSEKRRSSRRKAERRTRDD